MTMLITDNLFKLNLVNGRGENIEFLKPGVEYTLEAKKSYYLALEQGEFETDIPEFAKLPYKSRKQKRNTLLRKDKLHG